MEENIFVTRTSMPSYEAYCEAIKPLWDSHLLTNMGQYHEELEKKLTEYLGVPNLSLTVNGHMALELAIQAFDFPEGSEVITTPFTFVSTTHAMVRNRLHPVFCDVKELDGTIDEEMIEDLITPKTVAIVPVHVYGHICNTKRIQEIADKYGLKVIYDAAHAFGVNVNGKGAGNFGDVSVFSFHATKVYNTVEGGAVVCKTGGFYERLYNLKNFGIRDEELVVSVGANAKMNEFCAVMGLLNLGHIDEAISDRARAAKRYAQLLSDKRGIRIFEQKSDEITKNYAYYPILINEDAPYTRDELYERLKANGVFARKYFYPITADQACFKNRYKDADISVARKLSKKVLTLPLYEGLSDWEIDEICGLI